MLKIAKEENDDNLYQEEIELLDQLKGKVESFSGDSIPIDYLKPESEQVITELLLPVPEWAQEEQLNNYFSTIKQDEEDAERIFGSSSVKVNLDEVMKTKRKRKRKRQ